MLCKCINPCPFQTWNVRGHCRYMYLQRTSVLVHVLQNVTHLHLVANPPVYICKHTTPTSKHYIPVHSQHGNSTRKIENKCIGKIKFLPMSYPWDAYTELKGRATTYILFSIGCCTHSLMGCINGLNTSHCITHSCPFPQ